MAQAAGGELMFTWLFILSLLAFVLVVLSIIGVAQLLFLFLKWRVKQLIKQGWTVESAYKFVFPKSDKRGIKRLVENHK